MDTSAISHYNELENYSSKISFISLKSLWVKIVVCEPIEAEWCIYTSVNEVIIGSDNGLLPGRHLVGTKPLSEPMLEYC